MACTPIEGWSPQGGAARLGAARRWADAYWASSERTTSVKCSTDNARSWHEITTAPLSGFGFALAVHPGDAKTAWFVPAVADQQRVPVGAAMVVNRTRDGAASFETLRDGLPQAHAYDLVYRHGLAVNPDGQRLLMGSTTGGLWASSDGGEHWQAVSTSLPPIHAVRMG